ncbi:Fc receptor-like protein 6 [Thomomys bottae]
MDTILLQMVMLLFVTCLGEIELFQTPVLSAIPSPEPHEGSPLTLRCETKMHPQKSASRLLFSFYKDGYSLQDRGHHPVHCILRVTEEDSGIYWCEVASEDGHVHKQSYCVVILVQSSQVLSTSTTSNWLVAWLPGSLLGVIFIAAALLVYFRYWRKDGSQNPHPAPGGEQCPLHGNETVHREHQKDEGDESIIYTEVHTTLKKNTGHFCYLHRSEMPTARGEFTKELSQQCQTYQDKIPLVTMKMFSPNDGVPFQLIPTSSFHCSPATSLSPLCAPSSSWPRP